MSGNILLLFDKKLRFSTSSISRADRVPFSFLIRTFSWSCSSCVYSRSCLFLSCEPSAGLAALVSATGLVPFSFLQNLQQSCSSCVCNRSSTFFFLIRTFSFWSCSSCVYSRSSTFFFLVSTFSGLAALVSTADPFFFLVVPSAGLAALVSTADQYLFFPQNLQLV